ncbi:MAG: TonB-dependent receptor [Bacteroidales bacterium]|nr:TonB-dependent receptor [Bacteroidales bacterium]MCF8402379.1 TonB-dependent receptor [Bacteroidales bacterium]
MLIVILNAQSDLNSGGTITGKVVEKISLEPMQYASVALYALADTLTPLQGTTTDLEGVFIFREVAPSVYIIKVSFMGFETNTSAVFNHTLITDLGTLSIQPAEILLDDVTITSERSTLIHNIDKKVYNVGKDILSESGSASDILQNVPSITIDVDGNVSLRGTSNILFLVNGRPSALLRRNSASAFQQIPATSIERIEVITNPSAKYKPDGTGGIINIVLKKESKQGLNGQVIANVGNEERYNASLILNYGTEELDVFGSYSIRHSNRSVYYSDERINRDSLSYEVLNYYNETGQSKNDALSHIFSGGIAYELNDNNSLELSGTYFTQNTLHKGVSEIGTDNPFNQPETRLTSNETNDEYENEAEASLGWEHVFGKNEDHILVMEAAFSAYDEQEDLSFDDVQSFPDAEQVLEKILIQKSGKQAELTAEYSLPLSEDTEIEAGYAGEFIMEDIRYTNNLLPDRFLFTQNVHAFYALLGQGFGAFSFKAGLRVEQTNIQSHLNEPIDSLVNNNYFKPYPTLHLLYELDENQQVGLSYSKRINRPDADELNPNPEFSDPRNAEAGNPRLKPQQIHSLELGYQVKGGKLSFSPTLYYRYTYDAFTFIKTPISDSVLLTTIENLDKRQAAGLEMILSGTLAKNWDVDLSTNLFYNQIDATGLGFSEKKSVVSADLKLFSFYRFTPTTLFQFNAYYYSPLITPQGQRNQFYYFNAGLKQQLFDKRAALTFTVTDIFHTYRVSHEIDVPELVQLRKYRRKGAVVYLGFTWFFRPPSNGNDKEIKFEGEGL